MHRETNGGSVRAMVAGGIGGIAGTWAMNQFQRQWTFAVDDQPSDSAGGKHDARDWQERSEQQNSNELAAQALARFVLGRALRRAELQVAAPAVHFAFGASMAALYGRWASGRQDSRFKTGLAFGTLLWLAADEVAMPVLGLSQSTARRPFEMHLQAFVSHLVYGLTTELVRQSLDAALQRGTPGRRRARAATSLQVRRVGRIPACRTT